MRLEEIALDALWSQGVRGLIIDLDNTLLPYSADEVSPERCRWMTEAKRRGFALVILSNNFPPRVARIAAQLGIVGISSALKPLPFAFLRALAALGTPPRATRVIGDQVLTDILGGRLVGVAGILTDPLEPRDFLLTRVMRWVEEHLLLRRPLQAPPTRMR